jgi:hypothetical protein
MNIWGVRILKLEEAVRLYPNVCYVIANSRYSNEMKEQLIALGVCEEQSCCTVGVDGWLLGANF